MSRATWWTIVALTLAFWAVCCSGCGSLWERRTTAPPGGPPLHQAAPALDEAISRAVQFARDVCVAHIAPEAPQVAQAATMLDAALVVLQPPAFPLEPPADTSVASVAAEDLEQELRTLAWRDRKDRALWRAAYAMWLHTPQLIVESAGSPWLSRTLKWGLGIGGLVLIGVVLFLGLGGGTLVLFVGRFIARAIANGRALVHVVQSIDKAKANGGGVPSVDAAVLKDELARADAKIKAAVDLARAP